MIETSIGLVLRTYPLTETSLIVHWLTPTLGRMATVAKGARRPTSVFRGKIDVFYLADFSFSRSRRSELHTLREVVVRETHGALRQELQYLQQTAYCTALIEQTTETETPISAIFDLLRRMLQVLPLYPPQAQTVFTFEFKLLHELGLDPDFSHTHLSEGARAAAKLLAQAEWSALSGLRLSSAQSNELRQFLHGFLIFHLGRLPKGREAALTGG